MLSHELCGLSFCLVLAGCGVDESSSAANSSSRTITETLSVEGAPTSEDAETIESKLVTPSSAADAGVPVITLKGDPRIPFLFKTVIVKVTLTEGMMLVSRPTVDPAHQIFFEVRNATEEPHQFVVVETGFPPDKLPVENGRVRYFTYFDEPHTLLFRDGGGWLQQAARESPPVWGSHRKEPGVKILPGTTFVYKGVSVNGYDADFKSGTAFVIFCNDPGHYEHGEYASVIIK